ncbi:MAG: GNAT family N-acetyltransferase [bacterium]
MPSRDEQVVGAASAAADEAARRSGVLVRALSGLHDVRAATALFDEVWRPAAGQSMVPVDHALALSHAGNHIGGAFDGSRLVGASLGFFGAPPGVSLHSDLVGVRDGVRGRGVGLALKLHQRAWALRQHLSTITWTFDPLVRRNAFFNLVRLGARPREYLVDFYGDIDDGINAGQGSDRLFLEWPLAAPEVVSRCAGRHVPPDIDSLRAGGAAEALYETAAGRPAAAPEKVRSRTGVLLVRVPDDIEMLRRTRPNVAREWRLAVRDVLGGLLSGGARVAAFGGAGYYVVER